MKKFSYIKAIPYSFFSKDLYIDVIANWKGIGMLYSLLFNALYCLGIYIFLCISFNVFSDKSFLKQEAYFINQQIPVIEFKDGTASTGDNKRYDIRTREGYLIAVIDTYTDQELLPQKEGPIIVLTKNKVSTFKDDHIEVYEIPNDPEMNFVFTQEVGAGLIEQALSPVVILVVSLFIGIFVFLGIFVFRLIVNIITSVLGVIIAKIMKVDLDYEIIFRLSYVVATPAIIVGLLPVFNSWLVGVILTIGYFVFALNSFKNRSTQTQINNLPNNNGGPDVIT